MVKLRNYQSKHYNRVKNILKYSYYYIDGTEMGKGKSYIAAKIAEELGLDIIVISPLSIRSMWIDLVDPLYAITYESLRSVKDRQPNHGLLYKENGNFYPTKELKKLIDNGVLIVIDEFHHAKNNTMQNRAVEGLLSLLKYSKVSKAALLSATPVDNEILINNILRMIGVGDTVDKILNYIMKINPDKYGFWKLRGRFIRKKNDYLTFVYNAFNNAIKPKVMSIMTEYKQSNIKVRISNTFYIVDEDELNIYEDKVRELNKSVINFKQSCGKISNVTIALRMVQESKVPLICRIARDKLENKKCKIVIFAKFHSVIDMIADELSDYNILKLTGKVNEKERVININKFQENNDKYRIIICNIRTGGESINLHDIYGDRPRYILSMPSYEVDKQHQGIGRCDRDGTMSNVRAIFVYIDSELNERNILATFSSKGSVLKDLVGEQGIIFPNEYENIVR